MLRKLLATQNDHLLALLRVLLGVVFFAHGAQKMLGWFGGAGFSGTIAGLASFGMPTAVALYAIFYEFFAGLGLWSDCFPAWPLSESRWKWSVQF